MVRKRKEADQDFYISQQKVMVDLAKWMAMLCLGLLAWLLLYEDAAKKAGIVKDTSMTSIGKNILLMGFVSALFVIWTLIHEIGKPFSKSVGGLGWRRIILEYVCVLILVASTYFLSEPGSIVSSFVSMSILFTGFILIAAYMPKKLNEFVNFLKARSKKRISKKDNY